MSAIPIDPSDPRNLRAEVRRHLAAGRRTVPIPAGKKGPKGRDWHKIQIAAEEHDPSGNIGLVLGPGSGNLINIDCDCKEAVALAPLLLPPTPMISGRKGRGAGHRWYRGDASVDTRQIKDPDNLMIVELRCGTGSKGFQTVIPPSVHPSGETYEWYGDGRGEDPAPADTRELLRQVTRLAAAVLLVRAFPVGGRHEFALELAGALAEAEWVRGEAESFIRAVCAVGGSGDDAPKAAANVVASTWEKRDSGERVAGFQALGKRLDGASLRAVSKWLGLHAQAEEHSADAYSKEELERLARAEGLSGATALMRRWVVQKGGSYYLLTLDGYRGPYVAAELDLVLRQHVGRAPLRRHTYTAAGSAKKMTSGEFVETYGSSSDRVIADLTIERSRYEQADGTFREASCPPRRDLEPVYDAQVDRWLRLLGGLRADKLLDWVATYWDLSRQTAVLYVWGESGAGKGMLGLGLARLWSKSGATPLDSVVGTTFNSALTMCPFVLADEALRMPDSATLRCFIGSSNRTLSRKFLPDAELVGSPRLMIAMNRSDALRFDDEDYSESDVRAIAGRIVRIHAQKAAEQYLIDLGGREATESWVAGDRIVKHALWLGMNRPVKPGSRFLVEGDEIGEAAKLALQGRKRGLVAEAICRALDERARTGPHARLAGIFIGGGKLIINGPWLHEAWDDLVGRQYRAPTVREIGLALTGMSEGPFVRVRTQKHGQLRCHLLRAQLILDHAEELGIGDSVRMLEAVATGVSPTIE